MKSSYKYEILDILVGIVGIFYFAFGLLTSYYRSCFLLDNNPFNPHDVWDSIASIMCVMNFANIFIIIIQLFISRKNHFESQNSTTNPLFYLLSVPLFFGTFLYKILEIINKKNSDQFSMPMIIFEFLLCFGVMILIINVNFSKNDKVPFYQSLFRNFVLYISTIGMLNYLLYHFVNLHLNTFLEFAEKSKEYGKYYNSSKNTDDFLFQHSLEAVMILFYFVCISYLIFLKSKNKINIFSIEKTISLKHENISNQNPVFSFRIPPISIIFGVMCITITLLVIIVVGVMDFRDPIKCGIYALFPVPIYLLSIFLLILQINEMQNWKKLEIRNFPINQIFIRLGTLGQIVVAFSEIKFNIYHNDNQSLFVLIQYLSLISQIIIQTLALELALNRKWIPICDFKNLWSSICPPVGLLSMNIAFLMFSLMVADNKFCKFYTYSMSLELMRLGILSFGETLSVLHRLHSSLIFGKIAYLTYRQ